jgi:hypothetical protein
MSWTDPPAGWRCTGRTLTVGDKDTVPTWAQTSVFLRPTGRKPVVLHDALHGGIAAIYNLVIGPDSYMPSRLPPHLILREIERIDVHEQIALDDAIKRRDDEHQDSLAASALGRIEGDIPMSKMTYTLASVYASGESKIVYLLPGATSTGQRIVEVCGTKEVQAVDASRLTKNIEYTVSLRFLDDARTSARYDFFAVKDAVAVGDLVYLTGSYEKFARVQAINTKSEKATAWLVGSVFKGAPLVGKADDNL